MAATPDTTAAKLRKAFLDDHQRFARGIANLLHCVETGDAAAAAVAADEVDRVAGPHIEFEETALYPSLREVLGLAEIDRLYDEHDEGREAVAAVRRRPATQPFADDERRALIARLTTAQQHIATCGTLLSHLDRLADDHQQELLARLFALRGKARRWTSLDVEAGLEATAG